MKAKIYIKQWLELKPYNSQIKTDSYYLKISNDIKKSLSARDLVVLHKYLGEDEVDLLPCFLASWFEDIISGTNIWNAFVNLHFEHYGKMLPFYSTDEYFEGEINPQDIAFLTWYFMNTVQNEIFISPHNGFIHSIAENVLDIFENEYEYAPVNEFLKTFYEIDKNETDFYKARKLIDTVLFKTWLFYPDTALQLTGQEMEIIKKDNKNTLAYLNENRDSFLHNNRTRLMNLKGKDWAAKILGNKHQVSTHLSNISERITGYFFYKGQDDSDVFLEHIASGKKFNLTKKSFDYHVALKETDTILFIGIVQWRNEWWFSGVYFQTEFNADLVLDEKNSLESRKQVNFLDHDLHDTNTTLDLQYKAFLRFNNDLPVAFMPSDKIEEFVRNYIEYFNASLNLSEEEKEQAHKRAKAGGFFGNNKNDSFKEMREISETGLVFFNPKSGVEIAVGLNGAFAMPNNPWFDAKNSEDDIFKLLFSEQISAELVRYCIKIGKNKLPFLKKGEGKWVLDNLDFLLRFWKKSNYHARPEITYTGQTFEL
jgi:hypothetical protein